MCLYFAKRGRLQIAKRQNFYDALTDVEEAPRASACFECRHCPGPMALKTAPPNLAPPFAGAAPPFSAHRVHALAHRSNRSFV